MKSNFDRLQAVAMVQTPSDVLGSFTDAGKNLAIAAALTLAVSVSPAKADVTVGSLLGGIAGAVLGNQVGGGSGKTIATVAGGIVGMEVGHSVGNPPQQAASDNQTGDSTTARVIRKGGGAVVGGALGSMVGGGRGKTIATVAGAIIGAEVADGIFGPGKAQPQQVASSPYGTGSQSGRPFANGTQQLAPNERDMLGKAMGEVEGSFQKYADARRIAETYQRDYDFASGHEKDLVSQNLYRARSLESRTASEFNSNRTTFSDIVYNAAMKYGMDVSDYIQPAARWNSVSTSSNVSYEDMMNQAGMQPASAPANRPSFSRL